MFLPLLLASSGSSFVIPSKCSIGHSQLHVATPLDTAIGAKEKLLNLLQQGEDENSPDLTPYLDILKQSYAESNIDARYSSKPDYNGDWGNVNIPAFQGRLDLTHDGLPVYTIGRLTFNLIPSAKDVVVAVERMVQRVHPVVDPANIPAKEEVPEALQEALQQNLEQLRFNKIDTLFRIPRTNVRGILRTEGYTMPNPDEENRYDTWFVGGLCMPQEEVDKQEWTKVFGTEKKLKSKLHYTLPNPMPAYQTVEYLDEDLRVSVGNRGTLMIVRRE